MKTDIDASGVTTVTDGSATWVCHSPDQAAKHLATWRDERRNGETLSPIIEAGDESKIRDLANDHAKQLSEKARFVPDKKFVYVNGVAEKVPTRNDAPNVIVPPAEQPIVASLARRILEYVA